MTFTPEQLRSFAEVGGWQYQAYVSTDLPDFPNDLAACFDVLDSFSMTWQLQKHNACSGYDVFVWKDGRLVVATDKTKQAAIIAAVLEAKEAT